MEKTLYVLPYIVEEGAYGTSSWFGKCLVWQVLCIETAIIGQAVGSGWCLRRSFFICETFGL